MRDIIYRKDTEAYCRNCDSLIFIFNRDIIRGEKLSISQVYANKGQAPFLPFSKIICKGCGTAVYPGMMVFLAKMETTKC